MQRARQWDRQCCNKCRPIVNRFDFQSRSSSSRDRLFEISIFTNVIFTSKLIGTHNSSFVSFALLEKFEGSFPFVKRRKRENSPSFLFFESSRIFASSDFATRPLLHNPFALSKEIFREASTFHRQFLLLANDERGKCANDA